MKERPIIFTTESVKAILDGRKTMTRRVMKNPRRTPASNPISSLSAHSRVYSMGDMERELELAKDMKPNFTCPYGQAGDRLWVREAWSVSDGTLQQKYIYKADGLPHPDVVDAVGHRSKGRWRPSIHMFRKDSRILLEITEVRVERVQEITSEDAWAEGANRMPPYPYVGIKDGTALIGSFMRYWDSLNAKRGYSWKTNPWVWVISFNKMS